MTSNQIIEIAGYFANPKRKTHLEIEILQYFKENHYFY